MKKIHLILAILVTLTVSFSSCNKKDKENDPTPTIVTPPTAQDTLNAKTILVGSTWAASYNYGGNTYVDTFTVSSTEVIFVNNHFQDLGDTSTVETAEYSNSNETIYISRQSRNYDPGTSTWYTFTQYSKYEFASKNSDTVYLFNSGPADTDKTHLSNQWVVTFTKIQ